MTIRKQLLIGCLGTVFFLSTILVSCTPHSKTPSFTPITVQLRWTHQSQFAGFYLADHKGYYSSEGLRVSFLEGGPDVDLTKPVLDGTAQFGVTSSENLIIERANGKPLCAIATIYRRSPHVFFTLAKSGITQPEDFVGKTIHVPRDLVPTFRTIMARVGIRPGQYKTGNYGTDLTPFSSGQVHVWGGIINGKALYDTRKTGHQVNLIFPDDYGIHSYADTLFTSDDLITKDPDLAKRFLRATLKGWTNAVEEPTTVAAMVTKYKLQADAEYETASMIASIPIVNTGEDHVGWMKAEMWAGIEKTLREQGVLTQPVDVKQVYIMRFLEEIYKK